MLKWLFNLRIFVSMREELKFFCTFDCFITTARMHCKPQTFFKWMCFVYIIFCSSVFLQNPIMNQLLQLRQPKITKGWSKWKLSRRLNWNAFKPSLLRTILTQVCIMSITIAMFRAVVDFMVLSNMESLLVKCVSYSFAFAQNSR